MTVADVLTLLVTVVEDRPAWLLESVGSVLAQESASTRVRVLLARDVAGCRPVAAALARRDPAVTWQDVPAATAAAALDLALLGVTTPFCGVLDAGDQLLPGALAALDDVLADETVDMVYTDEQWTGGGPADAAGAEPELVVRLKPRLSPHYLETNHYTGRLTVHRVRALRAAGGWQAAVAEAVEWDAALRITDTLAEGRRVVHLPVTAVHRRTAPPEFDVRPERAVPAERARAAGRTAVADHLERLGQAGTVEDGPIPGFVRPRRHVVSPAPLVSIVIPTAGAHRSIDGVSTELVSHCLEHLESTTAYPSWRVHLVVSHHAPADLEDRLADRAGGVTATRLPAGAFNFSTSVNTGVWATDGPLVLLLNDDVIPLRADWLDTMVAAAMDERAGVVGAKLLDGEDLVQHAGVIHDDAFHPSHVHRMEVDGTGHFGSLAVAADYSAVTAACLLTPREVFNEVGGFWPDLGVAYGDVDYCWKVGATGRWCVMAPDALMRHYESSSRDAAVDPAELRLYLSTWGERAREDIGEQFRSVKALPASPLTDRPGVLEVEVVEDDVQRARVQPQDGRADTGGGDRGHDARPALR